MVSQLLANNKVTFVTPGSPGFLRILPGKARDQSTVLFTRSDVSMEVRAHGDAFPQSRGSAAPQRAVGGVRPFCTIITTRFAELKTHSRASAPNTDGKGFVPILNIYTIFVYNVTLFITVLCLFLIRTRSNLVRNIKPEATGPAIHTAVRVSPRSVRGLVSGAPQERLCLNGVDRLRSLSAPGGVDTGWAGRRTRRIGPGARPGGLRPVCRRYAQKQAENKTAGQEPREGRARAWRGRGQLAPHGGGAECWSSEIWVFEVRLALVSRRWLALLPAFDGQAAGLWPGQQDCFCSDIWTCLCSPEGHSLRNVLDSSGTWQLGDMAE